MMRRRKLEIKSIFLSLGIFALMILSSTGYSSIVDPSVNDEVVIYEKSVGISGEKAIKADIQLQTLDTEGLVLSAETQITSSEFDESYPAFDIDYGGNPFLLYQSYESMGSSKIYIQRSLDGGATWPEELAAFWEIPDLTPIKPDVDFTTGNRAFGTNEFEGYDPVLYYADYVNIEDTSSYALYSFDRSGYSTYVSETDVAANKSGAVGLAFICDYQGTEYYEDTMEIFWNADNFADGTAQGVYWMNKDSSGNSIPRSHLCGDAGDKIFFCYESKELGKTSRVWATYSKVDVNTTYQDWKTSLISGSSSYNCTYPDISVTDAKAYCVYMSDVNGSQDIYVAVTTGGTSWKRYKVADSLDDELYPVISANGEKATCLFTKNGNLYKTSTDDSGVTWSTPVQVNSAQNSVAEAYQNYDCEGTYGIWTDARNGNDDLYFDVVGSAPLLTIDTVQGGFGVKASISNIGTAPAEDELWSIDIVGNLVFAGVHTEGNVSVPAGGSATVSSGLILGFGRVLITVTVGDATKIVSGFVLGPFMLSVK